MFKFVPVRKQLREVQKQNVQLKDQVEQNRADLDFVAARKSCHVLCRRQMEEVIYQSTCQSRKADTL